MQLVLFAAFLAAAPLDASHAAVLDALMRFDTSGCDEAQTRSAARSATIRRLGRTHGDELILADIQQPCFCGAHNCPYVGIRLTRGRARELFTAYGFAARLVADPSGMPSVVVTGHDSALVMDETTYGYRGGTYAQTAAFRVRGDDGSRKPDHADVRFAPGASAATLHGTVAAGWYDVYRFGASRGQRLTVSGIRSAQPLTFFAYGTDLSQIIRVRAGVPVALPVSGAYSLHVDTEAGESVPYTLTLTIR
ncbi:MAG TPA: hypothetical protein VGD01_09310 [Candidatus Elarobacter sp.]